MASAQGQRYRYKRTALAVLWVCAGGCSMFQRTTWRPPALLPPLAADTTSSYTELPGQASALFYTQGIDLETKGDPACVDAYLQSAILSWPCIEQAAASGCATQQHAWQIYHSALTRLLTAAQKFGRWDSQRGIFLPSQGGFTGVAVHGSSSPWQLGHFGRLIPVGAYSSPYISKAYQSEGVGVPLVSIRSATARMPFTQQEQAFAVTALLRPVETPSGSIVYLELFDPLRESQVEVCGIPVALRRDISAPLAYASLDEDRQWLRDFLQPGSTHSGDGLFMIEPYQPSKIPVVFVHGLLSDPLTWANVANELRADRQIVDRYQIWGFRYSTGEPFLKGAAVLRRQLHEIRAKYDPQRCDPALSNMVLVGHSLGGLVSKLQVTYSDDTLWKSVSNSPFDRICATSSARSELAEAFFFGPQPDVSRVVYIGTPHQGSAWARRCIGRFGSALVKPSTENETRHSQLLRDNPGVFSKEMTRRIPTSIDLLEPSSPLLGATLALPYRQHVALHSIVGYGHNPLGSGPSDGVVPVSSARLGLVQSELDIKAKHSQLHQSSQAIQEIKRILRLHLQELDKAMINGKMSQVSHQCLSKRPSPFN